jgi:hypothetical protein
VSDSLRHAAVLSKVYAALRRHGLEPTPTQHRQILVIVSDAAHGLTATDPVVAALAVMGAAPPVEEAAPKPVPAKPKPAVVRAPRQSKMRSSEDLSDVEKQRLKKELSIYIDEAVPPEKKKSRRQLSREYRISERQLRNREEQLKAKAAKTARANRDRP